MEFPDLDSLESPENPVNFYVEDVEMPSFEEQEMFDWLHRVADEEGKNIREINYVFCSDEHLKGINIEFLDHDYYTDIITFDSSADDFVAGEMYISTERVADNAQSLNLSFDQELRRVIVHGLLHLMGYGDKSPDQEQQMREKEDHYLLKFKL